MAGPLAKKMNLLGLKQIIEWWANRNWKIRIGIPVVLLIIAGIMLLCGRVWIFGWLAGGILLAFGGKSKSEQNGYKF